MDQKEPNVSTRLYLILQKISIMNQNKSMKEEVMKSMKDELLSHLHEQYAENNNASFASIASVIVALIGVIGAYGYVFVHSSLRFQDLNSLFSLNKYSMDVLLLITIACLFIIAILFKLSIERGTFQRLEQIIIYKIREQYDIHCDNSILPVDYIPYGKSKNIKFVQYPYDVFCVSFIVTAIFIIIFTLIKFVFALWSGGSTFIFASCLISVLFFIALIVFYWVIYYTIKKERKRYVDRTEKYLRADKEDNNLIEEDNSNMSKREKLAKDINDKFWKIITY